MIREDQDLLCTGSIALAICLCAVAVLIIPPTIGSVIKARLDQEVAMANIPVNKEIRLAKIERDYQAKVALYELGATASEAAKYITDSVTGIWTGEEE